MLLSLNQVKKFQIHARDGDIGQCKDFLFDDRHWTIRYMVADTHKWLPLGRKVLVPPIAIEELCAQEQTIQMNITREQLKNSPSIDDDKPVSRQYEESLFNYFGYGYYWIGPAAWGEYAYPTQLLEQKELSETLKDNQQDEQIKHNHLRSVNEIKGYELTATDDSIGHLQDFILDTQTWSIMFVIIDTGHWIPKGTEVVLSPQQLGKISWTERAVHTYLPKQKIQQCPQYFADKLTDPEYINTLHLQISKQMPIKTASRN